MTGTNSSREKSYAIPKVVDFLQFSRRGNSNVLIMSCYFIYNKFNRKSIPCTSVDMYPFPSFVCSSHLF